MSDKVTVMAKWFDDIRDDPYVETTEQEMAYLMYATIQYGLTGDKVDLGEVFGKEFSGLNRTMPNIYGQIDNIQKFVVGGGNVKYDSDAIKELRLKGKTAKEICKELGYPPEKARSLTSNKGWIEAGKELKNQVQKSTESVQTENIENTEKDRSVQNDLPEGFDF